MEQMSNSPDIIPDSQPDSSDAPTVQFQVHTPVEDYHSKLEEEIIANFQKPNLPNVNIAERIIICLDVCYDDANALYRLANGTTFTPLNMMKRVLDFFIHTKLAINKRTEFALLILKDTEPVWVQNFSSDPKDFFNTLDSIEADESISETFDFKKVIDILQEEVIIPEYEEGECILPPPYIVRLIVLFGRSNCIPKIPMDDDYFNYLKKQPYFYTDILLAHRDDCALYKCEEIYDALQDLDNGYSYVFEVARHATKVHDCVAKLLAHPLQRPLQKNTEYAFGSARNCY